jgi:hypothetical protein
MDPQALQASAGRGRTTVSGLNASHPECHKVDGTERANPDNRAKETRSDSLRPDPNEKMNVRVTVPGRGYRRHSRSARAVMLDRAIVIQLGDGSTVEIFARAAGLPLKRRG